MQVDGISSENNGLSSFRGPRTSGFGGKEINSSPCSIQRLQDWMEEGREREDEPPNDSNDHLHINGHHLGVVIRGLT